MNPLRDRTTPSDGGNAVVDKRGAAGDEYAESCEVREILGQQLGDTPGSGAGATLARQRRHEPEIAIARLPELEETAAVEVLVVARRKHQSHRCGVAATQRRLYNSEDAKEGVQSFLEKRDAKFVGR